MPIDSELQPTLEQRPLALEAEEEVSIESLLERVQALHREGARFVTATCLDLGGKLEVLYHFDRNLYLSTLRLTVDKEQEVHSISGIYLCAFLVENEMKELFGLRIQGIAIDYQGRLLLAEGSPPAPMLKSLRGAER